MMARLIIKYNKCLPHKLVESVSNLYCVAMVASPTLSNHRDWHSFYSDPSDDVVFKSRDHVFFRASKFRLAQTWCVFYSSDPDRARTTRSAAHSSEFFKTIDTFLLPPDNHFYSVPDAQSLSIFLDLTTSRSIPPFGTTIHSPILLYDTFKSFGREKGAKWLLGVIKRYITENGDLGLPFLMDCMVEKNLVLTKTVLANLPVEGLIVHGMWEKLREVDVAWRWALLESVFGDVGAVQGGEGVQGDGPRRLVTTRSPAVVAEMFNPSGPVAYPP